MNNDEAKALGAACDNCPARGQPIVGPSPAFRTRLVIVGEAPTQADEKMRTPFAGRGGSYINARLGEAKVSRLEAHLTHAAMCRADTEKKQLMADACCAPRLVRELAALPAEAPIMLLGKPALKSVLGYSNLAAGRKAARGFIWKAPAVKQLGKAAAARNPVKAAWLEARAHLEGRTCLPSYAPGFIMRADVFKPFAQVDFRRAGRVVRGEAQDESEGQYEVVDKDGAHKALESLGPKVSLDVETDGIDPHRAELRCVGISDGAKTVVLWPWHSNMVRELNEWLPSREEVVAHNLAFDSAVLRAHGVGVESVMWADSMVATHAIASHAPAGLNFVVANYCDSAPWKIADEATGDEKGALAPDAPVEDLLRYNAADARLTSRAWKRMQPDLAPERRVYEADMKLAGICTEMGRVGIGVDLERKAELSAALGAHCSSLALQLCSIAGADFRPTPARVRDVLYRKFALPVLRRSEGGAPATDEGVLESLVGREDDVGAFARLLLEWRGADKVRSTYLDAVGGPGERDIPVRGGRAHFNWKALTVSGRLNCRFQSIPRYSAKALAARVREIYVPAPGHQFVYYDVSQAEMRLAAYLSGDPVFIEACRGDVHSNNARQVFPQAAHLTGAEWKPFRDVAKNLGFAISYCAEAETVFANLHSKGFAVSMSAVQLILGKLHLAYRIYYKWVEANIERCQRDGHLRSPFLGRIRWLGWYPRKPDVANFPIQSGLGDIVNARTVALSAAVPGRLVAQIHDACIYEVPDGQVDVAKRLIADAWAEPIPTLGDELRLPIDMKVASRFSEL